MDTMIGNLLYGFMIVGGVLLSLQILLEVFKYGLESLRKGKGE